MFYALDWLPMYESAKNGTRAEDTPPAHRRRAWGKVTSSLSADMTAKVDDVELGEVEALLRLIRNKYYKATVQSKTKLRRQLEKARLEDYADLGAYVAHLKSLAKTLRGLGTLISDEDMNYRLLEGLPTDYDLIKQAIKLPRDVPLTWEQMVFMLDDFADDPKVPGSSTRGVTSDTVHTTQEKGTCFAFAKGKCKRGDSCRFRHHKAPASHSDGRLTRKAANAATTATNAGTSNQSV
jgi:hypothetical protein